MSPLMLKALVLGSMLGVLLLSAALYIAGLVRLARIGEALVACEDGDFAAAWRVVQGRRAQRDLMRNALANVKARARLRLVR